MSAGKLTWGRRDWLGLMVLFLSSIAADVIGALLALWPVVRRGRSNLSALLLRLSLFTSLLNIAAAALH